MSIRYFELADVLSSAAENISQVAKRVASTKLKWGCNGLVWCALADFSQENVENNFSILLL